MNWFPFIVFIVLAAQLCSYTANAQSSQSALRLAYECKDLAASQKEGEQGHRAEFRADAAPARETGSREERAFDFCQRAEALKAAGDYAAEAAYESAILFDRNEPAYNLFYGDYLRNFRGTAGALIPDAERQYFAALEKLDKRNRADPRARLDGQILRDVRRGLADLYQRDGQPLWRWDSNVSGRPKPLLFFSTVNAYGRSTTDFGEVDDSRDFASEALFAASSSRLNRPLSKTELRAIVRDKDQFETTNRLRFRFRQYPSVDVFYRHRDVQNGQITSFFVPANTNDVSVHDYGLTIEKPLNLQPYFDFTWRGTYRRVQREGIVEFQPNADEDIDEFQTDIAISRFLGPHKATLEFTYVHQEIDPDVAGLSDRDRDIYAATLSFLFRTNPESDFGLNFDNSGLRLFGGIARDVERFGDVDVEKHDFFLGASAIRFKLLPFSEQPYADFTIQSNLFTSEAQNDGSQHNTHYRTDVTFQYRIRDEDSGKPDELQPVELGFLNLVVPFRHDIALDGPDDFENVRIGVGLNSKIIAHALGGTTFLASARYDFQRFYNLDEDLHLFLLEASMGF